MTRLLEYLLEAETAVVFDVDGVLAIYEFGELSHTACPDEDWETYVRTREPYARVPAVPQIQDFVARKGPERVFACTRGAAYEAPGKRAFVCAHYQIPERHVAIVEKKPEKLAFLGELAERLGVPRARVALVEDSVDTLDQAAAEGFTTVHVSSFFLWQ